jgi:hypothetical protein
VRAQQLIEGCVVLSGQDLGRRHHRGLVSGVVSHQRRHRRDHRFPAADVALQQPVHRPVSGEVGEDLVSRDALAVRESKGQRRHESLRQRDVVGNRDPDAGAAAAAGALARKVQQEELVERDSFSSTRCGIRVVRSVDLTERVSDRHQVFAFAHALGQDVGDAGRQVKDGVDPRSQAS